MTLQNLFDLWRRQQHTEVDLLKLLVGRHIGCTQHAEYDSLALLLILTVNLWLFATLQDTLQLKVERVIFSRNNLG